MAPEGPTGGPRAPPGPFQTLGLAILQGTCDIFQRSIKKPKSFQETCEQTKKRSPETCPWQLAIMPLKPTKYEQFDAASGRLKAHLVAPGGRPDPPGLSGCIIKANRIGQFSGNGTKMTKNKNMPMCQYAFKTNEISTF